MRVGYHLRSLLLALTALGQLASAIGVPLPAVGRKPGVGGVPYPCESRPCGCGSAAVCWAGDCCCYTLEEKLAWADRRGVEPPAHVRPLVKARKVRSASPGKTSRCPKCDPDWVGPPADYVRSHGAEPPLSGTSSLGPGDEHATAEFDPLRPPGDRLTVRWVVGVFAKKCHGLSPDDGLPLDSAVAPDPRRPTLPAPVKSRFDLPSSEPLRSITTAPPTPPPRHG